MEEGADGDAVTPGAHAFVVLGVTFLLRVAGIEAAEAVVVAAAVFSHGVGEGEAEVPPMVVACGDVRAGRLDAGGEAFNLVVERGGVGRIGSGRPGRLLGLLCLRGAGAAGPGSFQSSGLNFFLLIGRGCNRG